MKIIFQYNSYLDSSVFKTVSRLSDQLKEVIYFNLEDLKEDQTIGDINPIMKSDANNLKELNYELRSESEVENVIRQINFDIFGDSLVEIPDPNNTYSIFITCHLDSKIENNIDYS
jgi:hypothetical protein